MAEHTFFDPGARICGVAGPLGLGGVLLAWRVANGVGSFSPLKSILSEMGECTKGGSVLHGAQQRPADTRSAT